jgi:hypothetical protein
VQSNTGTSQSSGASPRARRNLRGATVTTPPPALTGEEGASRFNGEPTTLPSPKAVPQPWTFREELEGSSCRTTAIKAGGPEPPEGGDASWTNVGSFTSETSSDNPIKPVFRERPSDVVQPSVRPRVVLTWEMARRKWWKSDIGCPRGGGPPPATSEAGACSPSVKGCIHTHAEKSAKSCA